jgi:hypothetical protein
MDVNDNGVKPLEEFTIAELQGLIKWLKLRISILEDTALQQRVLKTYEETLLDRMSKETGKVQRRLI